jgi:hypothetical protein
MALLVIQEIERMEIPVTQQMGYKDIQEVGRMV